MSGKFEAFGRVVDRCESYIERRFAVALLFSERFTFESEWLGRIVDKAGVQFGQQVEIGAYRADFTLTHPSATRKIVIELDGVEHHGSKEAAERDRARDRELLALGWTTVRFAGREVTRDALACARQAMELLGPGLSLPKKALSQAEIEDRAALARWNGLSPEEQEAERIAGGKLLLAAIAALDEVPATPLAPWKETPEEAAEREAGSSALIEALKSLG